jgi:hypothetical protein
MPPLEDHDGPDAPLMPPPEARAPRGLGLLTFRQPAPEEEPIHSPSTETAEQLTAEETSGLAGPGSSPSDEWADDHAPSDDSGTSSKGSTPAGRRVGPNPFGSENLRRTFRNGVLLAGDQAHKFLATTEGKIRAGLYKTDEDDASGIGDPLARIAGRREGLGGQMSEDQADVVQALMALTNYATKQIVLTGVARQIDAGAEPVQHLPEGETL